MSKTRRELCVFFDVSAWLGRKSTRQETQLFYLCRRALFRAFGALRTFAVSTRIFVARFLRKCSVLSSLTPAIGFLSRLGVYVSGLGISIRETARTLERKTLSRAAPPTPTLAGLRPI